MGQFWTLVGLAWALKNALTLLTTNALTGVTTTGSKTVSAVSSTTDLAVGQFIVGAGIPAATTITAFDPIGLTITLSANATATSTTGSPTELWTYGTLAQALPLSVHLLTGVIPSSPYTLWSQLTEATFDGYAPAQVAYPPVMSSPDNATIGASFNCITFQPTDYTVPNTITGQAWTYTSPGATSPTLVAVEAYKEPTNLSNFPDNIRVLPVLALPCNCLGLLPSPIIE